MDELANGNSKASERIGSGPQGPQGLCESISSNRHRNIGSFKRSLATDEDDEDVTLSKGKENFLFLLNIQKGVIFLLSISVINIFFSLFKIQMFASSMI